MRDTEFGMLMMVKERHPSKAQDPILVTDSGIVTRTKQWQSLKASRPIRVLPSGIFTSNNSSSSSYKQPESALLTHSTVGCMENTTCLSPKHRTNQNQIWQLHRVPQNPRVFLCLVLRSLENKIPACTLAFSGMQAETGVSFSSFSFLVV